MRGSWYASLKNHLKFFFSLSFFPFLASLGFWDRLACCGMGILHGLEDL